MTRPRRFLQVRSSRPRANANASQRFNGRPSVYHAVGRTLRTPAVVEVHHTAHLVRLARAEVAHAQAVEDRDEADCADAAVWCDATPHNDRTIASVAAHHAACVARLDAADHEFTAAKRRASRPVGDLVTPLLVSLPQPRTWPNALPGGTSPRRALRSATGEHLVALLNGEA